MPISNRPILTTWLPVLTLCLRRETAVGEAFIIGSEEYIPLRDLVQLIAAEMGVPAPTRKIPLTPILWAAGFCEQVCVPLGIEPPLHRRRVSFFQNNRAFDISKAKQLLGYQPQISLREGIRRTISWYEEQGWLVGVNLWKTKRNQRRLWTITWNCRRLLKKLNFKLH
jgi:nucleoside-diphosphate-sugar epimerase